METELRSAETSDIVRIQELNAKLSEMEAEEHDSTIDPEWCLTEEAANWYRKRINQGNGFAVVAQEDQTVIGYAIGATGSAEEFRTTDTLAELETMYLQPEYRGQGIGTRLLEEFKDWADNQDADRLRVEASAQNKGAIRFYRDNGFEDYTITLEGDF